VFLFGILSLQVYYYFEHHGGDGPYAKALAAIVWALEFSRTISMVYLNYHLTITEPGGGSDLNFLHTWALVAVLGICALLDAVFQVFYAARIKILMKRWEIPVFCWTLAFAQFSIILSILPLLASKPITIFFAKYQPLLITVMACRITLDLCGALALGCYLPKSETKLSIRKYALLFIESGILSLILSVIMLITFLEAPTTYAWISTALVLGVAEMNCLITGLNSRHLWASGLPLVALGKKPTILAFYQPPRITDLNFDIQVEKSNCSSTAPSMNEDLEPCRLPSN